MRRQHSCTHASRAAPRAASASPAAKLYIVDSGEIEFTGAEQTVIIHKGDSVFVLPNEVRAFKENKGESAVMHLVMLENYPTN